jgi:phage replication O-like protein O
LITFDREKIKFQKNNYEIKMTGNKNFALQQNNRGFTRFPNDLFETILQLKLTLRELKVILVIIRFTIGFQKQEAELSVRFISKASRISFQHISETLIKLRKKDHIELKKSENHSQSRIISLKHYSSWNFNPNFSEECNSNSYGTVPGKETVIAPEIVTNKENFKERIKNTYSIEDMSPMYKEKVFYKNKFFFIPDALLEELKEKLFLTLTDQELIIEFNKMEAWIDSNKPKKDYKRFFMNWLNKEIYRQPRMNYNNFHNEYYPTQRYKYL